MPMDFYKFKKEIEREGYSIIVTMKRHYWVITPTGGKLILFAVSHGKHTKGKEVWDSYVRLVRKAIKNDKAQNVVGDTNE
jgi:hypothetical protein